MNRYLSPSIGAGNNSHKGSTSKKIFGIATYLPREGPETLRLCRFRHKLYLYRYLSTSRGAGNSCVYRNSTSDVVRPMYSQLLPREGPETGFQCPNDKHGDYVQIPIYLERGRKHTKSHLVRPFFCFLYRYLSTSRGAGNFSLNFPISISQLRIATYLPREGTETFFFNHFAFSKSGIATYLPQEGPETLKH